MRVRKGSAALAVAVLLTACAGGGEGGGSGDGTDGDAERGGGERTSLSLDDLRNTGSACPVDLEAAVADAGLQANSDLEVNISEGSGEGDSGGPPIDRLGGVYVACSLSVRADPSDDGAVRASFFATPGRGVYQMYAATLMEEHEFTREELLDLSAVREELEEIPDRIDQTDEGELVDLGFDAPIAVARIAVDGAQEAALLVQGNGSVSLPQTRSVAQNLLADT